MRIDALAFIDEDLRNAVPGAAANIADSLSRLASWEGAAGQVAIGDGDQSGWTSVSRAWLYLTTAVKLRHKQLRRNKVVQINSPSLETEVGNAAVSLCWSLFLDVEERSVMADILRLMTTDVKIVREAYWEYNKVGVFALELFFRACSLPSKIPHSFGPYQGIFSAWNDVRALDEGLSSACDEHCLRMEDTSEEWSAEFRHPPFDLVPAEILALFAVRSKLGLDTPRVSHPLIEGPLANPPAGLIPPEDALVDRISREML